MLLGGKYGNFLAQNDLLGALAMYFGNKSYVIAL